MAVIVVNNLCKQYTLGAQQEATMLREKLLSLLRRPFAKSAPKEILQALTDVSFKISQGEIVGIIGRNGAGKSTLLKILSRVTYPTSGTVKVIGRVSSLLEVGTGFHDELTGRENIYLNGSILGMRKKEVDVKLDAIVDFAGVDRFIETPIKRYSSGMRLRLGFAVAAHLDPDVLIVDEVLAVGDAGFQKKCLATMEGLRNGGRTVLFVSHNMAAVENLCTRGIWIDQGRLKLDGPTREVIEAYMGTFSDGSAGTADLANAESRRGSGKIRYTGVQFLRTDRQLQPITRSGDAVVIRMHYRANTRVTNASFGFKLTTEFGTLVTETSTWHHNLDVAAVAEGEGYIDLEIDCLNLLPGRYYLSPAITSNGANFDDIVENGAHLEVGDSNIYQSGRSIDGRYGLVFFAQRWKLDGVRMV
jgi:lipopolysaccharide transport system ATP-binding protein